MQLLLVAILLVLAAYITNNSAHSDALLVVFRVIGYLGLVVWALFFPNAVYLITELNFSHRKKDDPVPEYFDIIMVFTLAFTGVVNALASLTIFHFILLIIIDAAPGAIPLFSWFLVYAYLLLASFAIYLGRTIRFNSWDVLHPLSFFKKLGKNLSHKNNRHTAAGYMLFYSLTLMIAHMIMFPLVYAAIL